jgi:hypothetical protein
MKINPGFSLEWSILVFALTMHCAWTNAQDPDFNKTNIGFFISPNYSYRNRGPSPETDFRDGLEKSIFGYAVGFSAARNVSQDWGIESGLQFMHRGYATKKMLARGIENVNQIQLFYRFNHLGIPVKASYRKLFEDFTMAVKGGIIANFIVKDDMKTILEYPDHTTETHSKIDGLAKTSLTGVISFELGDRLYKNLYWEIGPTLYYDLSATLNDPIKTRLWDLGLNICMYSKIQYPTPVE